MTGERHALVTGAAGFIGSTLVDRLLAEGWRVTGIDNLSTGHLRFLADASASERFTLIEADIYEQPERIGPALDGVEVVFHLAANADVRFGPEHTRRDLEQNTIATYTVLEAMRAAGVGTIAFSSTGSVYGEPELHPTPEDAPFPRQTSLYGASKLAGEGLIAAYCEAFGMRGLVFRFVSLLGERYTHGHVVDFLRKLAADPSRLEVLGDGRQRKSYLYVGDCVSSMLAALERGEGGFTVFNLGSDEHCSVDDSIGWISDELALSPALDYTGGERGWVGDSPFIYLDTTRIRALGWAPTLSIEEGVRRTVGWLRANDWVLGEER